MIIVGLSIVVLLALLLRRQSCPPLQRRAGQNSGRLLAVLGEANFDSLKSFVLPHPCDGLVHIDFAILTSAGIVCVRVKDINGAVVGSAKEPQWHTADGGKRRQFLNPLIQNAGRAQAIRRILPDTPVFNLVVFTGKASMSPMDDVIPASDLVDWLRNLQTGTTSDKNLNSAWQTLRNAALTDEATLRDFEAQLNFG